MDYIKQITRSDLEQLEAYLDRLYSKLGIDIEFTRHFVDRVNDERNGKPISIGELQRLFRQVRKYHGKKIAQLGPDAQAVLKDMQTDVNLPFVLDWDNANQELDLIAKTVMRKKDFKTPNTEFAVEDQQVNELRGISLNRSGISAMDPPTDWGDGNYQPVKKMGDYPVVFDAESNEFSLLTPKGRSVILRVTGDWVGTPWKSAFITGYARMARKWQEKGLGPAFYAYMVKDLGLTLQSDTEQSPGAQKMWRKLATTPGIQVYGYNPGKRGKNRYFPVYWDEDDKRLTGAKGEVYIDPEAPEMDDLDDAMDELDAQAKAGEITQAEYTKRRRKLIGTISSTDAGQDDAAATLLLATPKKGLKESWGKLLEKLDSIDREDVLNTEVVVPGFARYTVRALMSDIRATVRDMEGRLNDQPGPYRQLSNRLDQGLLQKKLSALIATFDELEATRRKGGAASRGIPRGMFGEAAGDVPQLSFYNGTTDAHGDQVDGALWAYDKSEYPGGFDLRQTSGPGIFGYIEWSQYKGELQIQMIEVLDGYRRRGVATQLVAEIQKYANQHGLDLVWSNMTPDGAALKKSLGEGVGRITKQNQTADVGASEISKQAKKLGFRVNKDGYPKEHTGSKTHKAYNLGLTEDEDLNEWSLNGIRRSLKVGMLTPKIKALIKKEHDKLVAQGVDNPVHVLGQTFHGIDSRMIQQIVNER